MLLPLGGFVLGLCSFCWILNRIGRYRGVRRQQRWAGLLIMSGSAVSVVDSGLGPVAIEFSGELPPAVSIGISVVSLCFTIAGTVLLLWTVRNRSDESGSSTDGPTDQV